MLLDPGQPLPLVAVGDTDADEEVLVLVGPCVVLEDAVVVGVVAL